MSASLTRAEAFVIHHGQIGVEGPDGTMAQQAATGERGAATGGGSSLAPAAAAVLEGNWIGFATRPSRRLYPHQWSWDSACAALGWATVDQDRAAVELGSLFAARWANGLLPHIVFSEGGRYFPGPDYWQT